jgi:hypothetical protein
MVRSAIEYLVITAWGLFLVWLVVGIVGILVKEMFSKVVNAF